MARQPRRHPFRRLLHRSQPRAHALPGSAALRLPPVEAGPVPDPARDWRRLRHLGVQLCARPDRRAARGGLHHGSTLGLPRHSHLHTGRRSAAAARRPGQGQNGRGRHGSFCGSSGSGRLLPNSHVVRRLAGDGGGGAGEGRVLWCWEWAGVRWDGVFGGFTAPHTKRRVHSASLREGFTAPRQKGET
eukprot:scaffold2600_cov103-Isochrysis_galbana.AAC.4